VQPQSRGFSLVELAVVLFIMGILLQAGVSPLAQKMEHSRRASNAALLLDVQQQLRAFWVSHGRLPCPLTPHQHLANETPCTESYGGVPASELGMVGAISQHGALLDAWGRPLRYHVSLTDVNAGDFPNTPDWTTADEITRVPFTRLVADLSVCREVRTGRCAAPHTQASDLVAVVVAEGKTQTPREVDNRDADNTYITAPFAVGQMAFDDQVVWLSRSDLIYQALLAGRLR